MHKPYTISLMPYTLILIPNLLIFRMNVVYYPPSMQEIDFSTKDM